jgi:glycosyltransferase involved in cell wall biosynthesis
MRVLFLPTNVGGVAFWRMYQFFRKMKEKGVDAFIYNYKENANLVGEWEHRFAYDENTRSEIYGILKHSDVGVVQYIHLPIILAVLLMFQDKFHKKFLAEIDDEVIDTPAYNPAYKGGWVPGNPFEKVVIEHLRSSNGIITSTDFLKSYYAMFNKNIHTMPNCIDFGKWGTNRKRHDNKVRIGWIGGGNHDEDLRIMLEVIPAITSKHTNVEFYFVHGVPDYLKNLKGVQYNTGWRDISKYPDYVASWGFDIGLAPLEINKFNNCKSNLRWLEYSALKIPTVATKIEPYEKSIVHGQTGFLCETAQDWIDNLSMLIDSQKDRRDIGNRAFDDIHSRFNLDTVTDDYIKTLKEQI